MLLSPDASLCEKNQTIVVSRDKGKVEHRAINPQGQFDLRHYQLDGVLIKQTCGPRLQMKVNCLEEKLD